MHLFGQLSTRILWALLGVAGLSWLFIELADAVVDNETQRFDTTLILAFRNPTDASDPLGPVWLEELARDITGLGGVGVLTFLVLASAGFLWLQHQRRLSIFLLLVTITGILFSQLLKSGFDRPRPDLVSHEAAVYTASFPSGHSLMATLIYLSLAVLLARSLQSRAVRAYIIALASFVVVSVGISRIYLGVHWPTDVLAGWVLGALWALLCGALARWLALRGTMDDEQPDL